MEGELVTRHCTNSTSATFRDDEWVTVEETEEPAWAVRVERALRESESRYRSLVDSAPEAIVPPSGLKATLLTPAV